MINDKIISINPRPYRGKDKREIAKSQAEVEAANQLEMFLQEKRADLQEKRVERQQHVFSYDQLAQELGLNVEIVRSLGAVSGGGNNGFTI